MPRKSSIGLSGLVAAILLIAITVAAAVVVSGVFFNLSSIAGRRPTAIIDQVKLVATPGGNGTWAIVIKNTGDVPITTISVGPQGGPCAPGSMTFQPIPVNPGATAQGTVGASGCNLGQTYPVTITIRFQNESQQVLLTQATASIA